MEIALVRNPLSVAELGVHTRCVFCVYLLKPVAIAENITVTIVQISEKNAPNVQSNCACHAAIKWINGTKAGGLAITLMTYVLGIGE